MKKILKSAMLFAMAGIMSLSFSSCSDSDSSSSPAEEQNNMIQEITNNYLSTVVYPTYTSLANESDNLYQLISALNAKAQAGTTISQSDVDAICTSYKAARKYWEQSEAFLYGAASDFEIDPHIDTWPLVVATLAEDLASDAKIAQLKSAITNGRARDYVTKENLGFHGIEFIFFRDGSNRSASFFNNDATEDYTYKGEKYFDGKNVTVKEEVIFATAIACDLRDKCWQLEVAWLGSKAASAHQSRVATCATMYDDFQTTVSKNGLSYGENLSRSTANTTYATWKKVMEEIFVAGCSNICAEVAGQKMGQAYRCATGQAELEDDPNYIESPYSYNSFKDFYDNIMSIQNSLYGNVESTSWKNNSIMAYLVKYNSSMATELNSKLQKALNALMDCRNSDKAFVQDPGATYVKTAMDAVNDLDSYLNTTSKWVLAN